MLNYGLYFCWRFLLFVFKLHIFFALVFFTPLDNYCWIIHGLEAFSSISCKSVIYGKVRRSINEYSVNMVCFEEGGTGQTGVLSLLANLGRTKSFLFVCDFVELLQYKTSPTHYWRFFPYSFAQDGFITSQTRSSTLLLSCVRACDNETWQG